MPAYDGCYEWAIRPFVDAMRVKLFMNKHKDNDGRWGQVDLYKILDQLEKEVLELRKAIANGNTTEILLESADCANFAMIAATVAIDKAKAGEGSDWSQQKHGEREKVT